MRLFTRERCRLAQLTLLVSVALAGCGERSPTEVPLSEVLSTSRPSLSATAVATPAGYIRIGVVPAATSVATGGTGPFVVKNRTTGAVLLTADAGTVSVSLGSNSVSVTRYRLQVTCTSEAGRDALIARAQAQGVATYAENAGPCWRVMLGSFDPPPASTYSARVAFKNDMIARGLAASDAFWKVVTSVSGTTVYRVSHSGGTVDSGDPVRIEAVSGHVLLNGQPYRGAAEVAVNSSGALAGINELPLEQYLYGVVPRELGPIAYPEVEAQKAQAVAARTYALSGLGKRRADGYDLLATTADQVYGGYGAEHPVSNQAVDETAGIVATYEGRLIQALFSSTSGGHTSDNEEVYNSSPVAYLRGVPDAQRGRALEHVPTLEVFRNSANPASLRATRNGDFEANWARYHRWTFEWTAAEISSVISAFAGQNVGRVLAINTLERGPSGRVLRIEYVTEAGTFYDTKDRIRSSLKFINSTGTPSNLLSTLFFIEPVTDRRTREVTGFKVYGGGFGHGVGMAQTGAVGMAEKGATYDEILKHYYRGITLEARQP